MSASQILPLTRGARCLPVRGNNVFAINDLFQQPVVDLSTADSKMDLTCILSNKELRREGYALAPRALKSVLLDMKLPRAILSPIPCPIVPPQRQCLLKAFWLLVYNHTGMLQSMWFHLYGPLSQPHPPSCLAPWVLPFWCWGWQMWQVGFCLWIHCTVWGL